MADDLKANNAATGTAAKSPKGPQDDVADVMQKHVQAKDGMPSLVTKFHYPAEFDTAKLGPVVVDLLMSATDAPGFLNAEIIPPEHIDVHEWLLIQRFRTAEQTDAWRASASRLAAQQSVAATLPGLSISDDVSTNAPRGNVVTAIITDVKPGMEAAYRQWETKVQSAQTTSPGYRGAYLQPPILGSKHAQWTTLLRFDAPESLEKWFHSDIRHKLVDEGNALVKKVDFLKITGSFPGWFPTDPSGKAIPNWKAGMLVLLGLFPIVMLQIKFLAPQLKFLNPACANIMSLAGSVFGTTFVTMPMFIPWFKWWLLPAEDAPPTVHVAGAVVVLCLYAIEIAIFWSLLLPPK